MNRPSRIRASERPRYHIVPSAVVAKFIRDDHGNWLKTPGRRGQAHVDNSVRKFHDRANEYLERWELLGLGPQTMRA